MSDYESAEETEFVPKRRDRVSSDEEDDVPDDDAKSQETPAEVVAAAISVAGLSVDAPEPPASVADAAAVDEQPVLRLRGLGSSVDEEPETDEIPRKESPVDKAEEPVADGANVNDSQADAERLNGEEEQSDKYHSDTDGAVLQALTPSVAPVARSHSPEDSAAYSPGPVQEQLPSLPPDIDEDRKNPAFIPKKGPFYQHDMREDVDAEKEAIQTRKQADMTQRWSHDMYNERDQTPKSMHEIMDMYGYDIRREEKAPLGDSGRRYNRPSNRGRDNDGPGRRRSRSQDRPAPTQQVPPPPPIRNDRNFPSLSQPQPRKGQFWEAGGPEPPPPQHYNQRPEPPPPQQYNQRSKSFVNENYRENNRSAAPPSSDLPHPESLFSRDFDSNRRPRGGGRPYEERPFAQPPPDRPGGNYRNQEEGNLRSGGRGRRTDEDQRGFDLPPRGRGRRPENMDGDQLFGRGRGGPRGSYGIRGGMARMSYEYHGEEAFDERRNYNYRQQQPSRGFRGGGRGGFTHAQDEYRPDDFVPYESQPPRSFRGGRGSGRGMQRAFNGPADFRDGHRDESDFDTRENFRPRRGRGGMQNGDIGPPPRRAMEFRRRDPNPVDQPPRRGRGGAYREDRRDHRFPKQELPPRLLAKEMDKGHEMPRDMDSGSDVTEHHSIGVQVSSPAAAMHPAMVPMSASYGAVQMQQAPVTEDVRMPRRYSVQRQQVRMSLQPGPDVITPYMAYTTNPPVSFAEAPGEHYEVYYHQPQDPSQYCLPRMAAPPAGTTYPAPQVYAPPDEPQQPFMPQAPYVYQVYAPPDEPQQPFMPQAPYVYQSQPPSDMYNQGQMYYDPERQQPARNLPPRQKMMLPIVSPNGTDKEGGAAGDGRSPSPLPEEPTQSVETTQS